MSAKHALIIAYYFPPLGMGGVQRMAKLAKYLPSFGYDISVLTVKPIAYPAYDQSLLDELPAQVTIYRSGSTDPARIAKLLGIGPKGATVAKSKSWDSTARSMTSNALESTSSLHPGMPICSS